MAKLKPEFILSLFYFNICILHYQWEINFKNVLFIIFTVVLLEKKKVS